MYTFQERQNQLWDNLVVYAERNKQLDQNSNGIKKPVSEIPNEDDEKREIEFHYAEGTFCQIDSYDTS